MKLAPVQNNTSSVLCRMLYSSRLTGPLPAEWCNGAAPSSCNAAITGDADDHSGNQFWCTSWCDSESGPCGLTTSNCADPPTTSPTPSPTPSPTSIPTPQPTISSIPTPIPTSNPTTVVVAHNEQSLRKQIKNAAKDGSTIVLLNQSITLTSQLNISRPLTLRGTSPDVTIRGANLTSMSRKLTTEVDYLAKDSRAIYVQCNYDPRESNGGLCSTFEMLIVRAEVPTSPCDNPFECKGAAFFIDEGACVKLNQVTVLESSAYEGAGMYVASDALVEATYIKFSQNKASKSSNE